VKKVMNRLKNPGSDEGGAGWFSDLKLGFFRQKSQENGKFLGSGRGENRWMIEEELIDKSNRIRCAK
jgi:hypothetical protein